MPTDEIFTSRPENDKGPMVSIRVILEGKVQNVGMREWIKTKAIRLKICGWVRNRMNETVEALFYGHEGDVIEMVKLCHQGPSFAHVKRVKEFPQSDGENHPIEFIILPSI